MIMINTKSCMIIWIITLFSTTCVGRPLAQSQKYLSEKEVIKLIKNPRDWDNKVFRVKIFPYDNGFDMSYVVCFEKCDGSYAQQSPYIIVTSNHRFSGYKGETPVVVKVRYSSSCFYKKVICADGRFGEFTEIP